MAGQITCRTCDRLGDRRLAPMAYKRLEYGHLANIFLLSRGVEGLLRAVFFHFVRLNYHSWMT